jgi:hypothetical protein
MKKYWKLQNTSDIKQCLQKLNVGSNYIEILLEEDSAFMIYLNESPKPKYVYITYKFEKYLHNYFGWMEDESLGILNGWQFCGEINLRKEKLKKLNEEHR